MNPTEQPVVNVAVVAFNDISLFHLSVPTLVFDDQRKGTDMPRFRLRICAAEPGPLRTSAGLDISTAYGLEGLSDADIIVVPSWRDVDERPPQALVDELQRANTQGKRILGLCLGAFVLAEAGLLDGQKATTHWAWAAEFAAKYPKVLLDADVLYADAGNLLTSAGSAAGLDCCLYLLQQLYGAEITHKIARRLVVAPHRSGGQAQFIERPVPVAGEQDRMGQLLEWLGRHFTQPQQLDALAERAAMSRRTFTRHFKQLTGTTVGDWLLGQRLSYAQRMLERSTQSIEAVALESGFGSALSLRQHFSAALQTSPSAYRAHFQGRQAGREHTFGGR